MLKKSQLFRAPALSAPFRLAEPPAVQGVKLYGRRERLELVLSGVRGVDDGEWGSRGRHAAPAFRPFLSRLGLVLEKD